MARIERTIEIACAPEEVFALLTDLDRLPDWATIVVETRDHVAGPLRNGATFRQTIRVLGQELESDWYVAELQPGRHVAYEATGAAGARLAMKQNVVPAGSGSRVELELDYDLPGGILGEIADKLLVERRNEGEAEQSLANLKRLLEAEADGAR